MPATQSQPWNNESQVWSQSQLHEHVAHYGSLNLEGNHRSTFPGISGIVNGGDILGLLGENELEIRQQFPDNEAVLFVVKTYSIRRSVEYKVL